MRRLPQQEALRLRVLSTMEKHLEGPASMETLAHELGISIRSFTSLCQRVFGTSPARLFLLLRLRKAEAELLKRQRSIKEISDRLGFANPYHFSRAFRRHMGHPPSEV
jgi:AraC-like DNA-binding protein